MKCCKCEEELNSYFSYKYKGDYYCEDCLGELLFDLDHLIFYIDSDTELQDEIYIEQSFGCELKKSSALLRKICRTATLEEWLNGNDEWKKLQKHYAWRSDFLEMFGAERITKE